jgi:hypothetical protein
MNGARLQVGAAQPRCDDGGGLQTSEGAISIRSEGSSPLGAIFTSYARNWVTA